MKLPGVPRLEDFSRKGLMEVEKWFSQQWRGVRGHADHFGLVPVLRGSGRVRCLPRYCD
jgi:hypothetical protein